LKTGLTLNHVPYKGGGPALADAVAGQIPLVLNAMPAVVPHIKDGLVRPLAVTTLTRTAVLPEVPTVAELGIPGFDATTWHGLVAPAGTPQAVIETLHRATVTALNDPAVRKALGELGVDPVGSSPAEFSAYIKAEIPKWRAVVQAAGGRLD
jgi:tripartite-type tricarboxylate transporter receptor subunit TctC